MNQVILQGNVTRDSEVREFANGGSVTKFGVATNRSYQKDGEWKEVVQFIDCEYFRSIDLRKGDPVLVVGELENQTWQTNEGEKRYKTIVRANKVQKFGRLQKAEPVQEPELVGAGVGEETKVDGIPF